MRAAFATIAALLARAVRSSDVSISGSSLFVNGSTFFIKGVCWHPTPLGSYNAPDFAGYVDTDAPLMAAAGINVVRTYTTLADTTVLDTLRVHGIYVINEVFGWGGNVPADVVPARVRSAMDHAAVLMWNVGNEWNYNDLYTYSGNASATRALVRAAARVVQETDPSRPVSTVYGEGLSAAVLAALDDVIDVWGFNIYRMDTFGTLFEEWAALGSTKPMYLGEFGLTRGTLTRRAMTKHLRHTPCVCSAMSCLPRRRSLAVFARVARYSSGTTSGGRTATASARRRTTSAVSRPAAAHTRTRLSTRSGGGS